MINNNQAEADHTEVQFRTVDDILDYYNKRHKEMREESVN